MSDETKQEQAVWPQPPRGLKPRALARWVRSMPTIVRYHSHEAFPYTYVVVELTVSLDGGVTGRALEGVGFSKCAPCDYAAYSPGRGYVIAKGRAEIELGKAIWWEQGPSGGSKGHSDPCGRT